ncbi:rhodanese-like domain-containing protein [Streptomyces sp. NPDC006365]|uniref:rhodanese-like domain-containing protein n=1 Tax=Streptomyces sp. NPDC006365 TaxID=3364744 RepID=UPI0036BD1D51
MSIFRRARGGPSRVSVQEARPRAPGAAGHAVLLEVREPCEWQVGRAPRAVHLPLSAPAAGAGLPAQAQERPLVVICRSGNRSRQDAELLVARGSEAVDVIGGMRERAGSGLPAVDARGRNGTVA